MEINYVCSLGSFCHTACYLRNNKIFILKMKAQTASLGFFYGIKFIVL